MNLKVIDYRRGVDDLCSNYYAHYRGLDYKNMQVLHVLDKYGSSNRSINSRMQAGVTT